MGETPNTGLYTEVSKQALVIREGESKTSVVRKSGGKELPTRKHFFATGESLYGGCFKP